MRNILKFILAGTIILLIACILIIIKTLNINNDKTSVYIDTSQYLYSASEDRYKLIQAVCEKNGNWENYYLSKKFRKKYKEKDGYFGKIEFDKVEVQPYTEDEYPFAMYPHIILTQGNKKTAYIYKYKYSNDKKDPGLEDIIVSYSLQLTDENGNKLDAKSIFTDNMKKENLANLARGSDFEKNVAVTDKFHKKYPFFLDLFIHYSPLSYNDIAFLREESDLDNNIAIFEVNSILECKRRKYEVKLIFDDKLYLDNVEVKLLDTREYKGDSQERINKVTYQNSNWDSLKLTDKFKKKYNSKKGIIDDIDTINIDITVDEVTLEANKKYITCFTNKEGEVVSYYFEYIKDEDNNLDDVICEKLPYINRTAAEAKELYLKEHNK